MVIHVIFQYSWYGLSKTGMIALIIMGLQGILGIMLKKNKNNKKTILMFHRLVPIMLIIILAFHPA
jgi:hypothetical protein